MFGNVVRTVERVANASGAESGGDCQGAYEARDSAEQAADSHCAAGRQQAAVVVGRWQLGLGSRLRGRMRQLIVGDGPVPLRPDVCRDAPRDIGLVRWLQDDLIRAVELGLAPAIFGHEPTAIGWAGGAERSVGGGDRR